jgi:hypothetical protein
LEQRLCFVCGWNLAGFQLVLQSLLSNGVGFDPFSFQEIGPTTLAIAGKIMGGARLGLTLS